MTSEYATQWTIGDLNQRAEGAAGSGWIVSRDGKLLAFGRNLVFPEIEKVNASATFVFCSSMSSFSSGYRDALAQLETFHVPLREKIALLLVQIFAQQKPMDICTVTVDHSNMNEISASVTSDDAISTYTLSYSR